MRRPPLFFLFTISLLQPAGVRADAARENATIESPASASRKTEQIVDWAREMLEQVVTLSPDKRALFDFLVKDAQGIALFSQGQQAWLDRGEISDRGVLIYREKDGNWSLPILLGIRGTSIGLQLGAMSSGSADVQDRGGPAQPRRTDASGNRLGDGVRCRRRCNGG